MSLGKYSLYLLFHADAKTRPFLPETALCNRVNLQEYLDKYENVFIKPTGGLQGLGVTKAWKENNQYAFIVEQGPPKYCQTTTELYNRLGIGKWGNFVVQRGLEQALKNGRPYDIRLMMMRDKQDQWQYVGMLARVNGENSIISNIKRGKGYVTEADTALEQSLGIDGEAIQKIKDKIIDLGYACNVAISRYRYYWEIGYDIGIDPQGNIWIIEANPGYPDHSLFAKLKDKTMYRKILQMAKLHKKK